MRMVLLLVACALLVSATPAHAQRLLDPVPTAARSRYPNFLGATGLLYVPSAYTIGDRNLAAHVHGNADIVGGGLLGGITERFEVGFTVVDADPPRRSFFDRGGTRVAANAKLLLLEERDVIPAVTFGVIDAFNELKRDSSWYVVGSKYFTRGDVEQRFALIGHLGYGAGVFDDEIFAGAELVFDQNVSAMAELQDGMFNVGLRGRMAGFAATVGLFDLKQFGGGVSYSIRF